MSAGEANRFSQEVAGIVARRLGISTGEETNG
jgi:hypothetical protein